MGSSTAVLSSGLSGNLSLSLSAQANRLEKTPHPAQPIKCIAATSSFLMYPQPKCGGHSGFLISFNFPLPPSWVSEQNRTHFSGDMERFFSVPQDGDSESCDCLYKHIRTQRRREMLELRDNSGTGANRHKVVGKCRGLEIKRLQITKINNLFKRSGQSHGSASRQEGFLKGLELVSPTPDLGPMSWQRTIQLSARMRLPLHPSAQCHQARA